MLARTSPRWTECREREGERERRRRTRAQTKRRRVVRKFIPRIVPPPRSFYIGNRYGKIVRLSELLKGCGKWNPPRVSTAVFRQTLHLGRRDAPLKNSGIRSPRLKYLFYTNPRQTRERRLKGPRGRTISDKNESVKLSCSLSPPRPLQRLARVFSTRAKKICTSAKNINSRG